MEVCNVSKKFYWLKLKDEFFNQREIKKLRKIAGGDTFTIVYLKMLLLSIKREGLIAYEGTEKDLSEQLALELDEDIENVKMTLAFLNANSLIEQVDESDIYFSKIPQMIGRETESAERMRRLRAREKLQAPSQSDEDVQNSDIEIEIEIEKDIEKEREQKDEALEASPKSSKRFLKPNVEEIHAYCLERGNTISAQVFFDYYEACGWMIGQKKMKDWKATIRTWEGRQRDDKKSGNKPKNQNFSQSTIASMEEAEMKAILARKAQRRQDASRAAPGQT